MNNKLIRLGLAIFLVILFFGCVPPNTGTYGTPGGDMGSGTYQPKPPPGITTPEAAKADLDVLLNKGRKFGINPGNGRYYSDVDLTSYSNVRHLTALMKDVTGVIDINYNYNRLRLMKFKSVPVLDDRIEVAPRMPFFYADLPDYTIAVTRYAGEAYGYVVHFGNRLSFLFDNSADARRFADDLFVIQQSLGKGEEEWQARFEAKVAEYRATGIKPPVTEEQRKYIVQANARSKRKEYLDAIYLYRKAVDLEPVSYPAAYFNMALLSGQLRRYDRAIDYMKRYLMLEPNAKDARSAQDKIYEWEMLTQERQP